MNDKERKQLIEDTYKRYYKKTNMSYNELLKWKNNPCSKKASIGRTAINRNLRLLSKPKNKWTMYDVKEAKKMLAFEARHSKGKAGKEVKGCGVSKRTIARKNWAVDPNK